MSFEDNTDSFMRFKDEILDDPVKAAVAVWVASMAQLAIDQPDDGLQRFELVAEAGTITVTCTNLAGDAISGTGPTLRLAVADFEESMSQFVEEEMDEDDEGESWKRGP